MRGGSRTRTRVIQRIRILDAESLNSKRGNFVRQCCGAGVGAVINAGGNEMVACVVLQADIASVSRDSAIPFPDESSTALLERIMSGDRIELEYVVAGIALQTEVESPTADRDIVDMPARRRVRDVVYRIEPEAQPH